MPMMKTMLWFLGRYKTESIFLPLKGILEQTILQTNCNLNNVRCYRQFQDLTAPNSYILYNN